MVLGTLQRHTASIRRALALGTGLLLATALTTAAPAAAAGSELAKRSPARLCDPTGCYVAWRIVDSDRDGVSDADELMAGTDPHDPRSVPLLQHVVDLAADRKLPSFEAGLGGFVAFPEEIIKAMAKPSDPLSAFPLGGRRDTLTRLGITDALTPAGARIDLDRDGFTIGLDGFNAKDTPARIRINGMDASLISAGASSDHYMAHGGSGTFEPDGDGGGTWKFPDGSTDTQHWDGDHITIKHTNPDSSEGTTREIQTHESTEDGVKCLSQKESVTDAEGNLLSVTYTDTKIFSGGTHTRVETTEFKRDAEGNVIGQRITVTETYHGDDGTTGTGRVIVNCNADGGDCSEEVDHGDSSGDHEHYDPEYQDTWIVSQETVDKTLRNRGAAITVRQDWTAPGNDGPADPRNPALVMLVDPAQSEQFMLVEPMRVTKAQPEFRDDLPSPQAAAPKTGGGCNGLC
ncbi:thrombospondin type 3 repeat-containing protein [Catellatospora tritici]|uniref:thrombospondin type 3 repeat-containing protein n=1 Tax=Catellatospora tritici TaxID=2851566 RepID=UPI001C2D0BBA|nr:thrombospondin type 3 repeat-containing protein [Catellatospora tritici]MBV1854329.1 thrombospondin type 3 repeat-containing protein [Catellatospora tritici]